MTTNRLQTEMATKRLKMTMKRHKMTLKRLKTTTKRHNKATNTHKRTTNDIVCLLIWARRSSAQAPLVS